MEKQPKKITDLLGLIVFNFSNLELVLSCFVTKLISDDSKIGAIVTAEMSFLNLLKAFDSLTLYKIKDKEQLKSIRTLIKKLNSAEQERNAVIHSAYLMHDKNNEAAISRLKLTAKQDKGLKITSTVIDKENLKRQTNNLVELIQDLASIYKKLYNEEDFKIA